MSAEGLSKTFTFHVGLDEGTQKVTVADDRRQVQWEAGVDDTLRPVVSGSAERTTGRVIEVYRRKQCGWSEDGSVGPHESFASGSVEGRALIKMVNEEQGWSKRTSGTQKVGLYVGSELSSCLLMGAVALVLVLTC